MSTELHPDAQLIERLGGVRAVAKLCDIRDPSVYQWRHRGIPRARRQFLELLRPDIFATGGSVPAAAVQQKAAA